MSDSDALNEIRRMLAAASANGARTEESPGEAPKAVIWVIGRDRPGILAAVTGLVFRHGGNILEVQQTVMQGMFAMVLMADLSALKVSFAALKRDVEELGREMGLMMSGQRNAIFEQMHRL